MKYHNIPTLFDNQASLINGKNIGTDSVRYIQDAGQKTAGTTYIDKNTNELYVCVTTTNSVNNDSNFSKFNLKEAFNKLDRLIIKQLNFAIFKTNIGRNIRQFTVKNNDSNLLVLISCVVISSSAGGNYASSGLSWRMTNSTTLVIEWNQTFLSGDGTIGLILSYLNDKFIQIEAR